jgi:methyl-accepting chemotaxis protein
VDEELNEETSKLVAQNLLKNVLTDEMNEEDKESLINKTALLLLEKQKNQEEIKGIGALIMKGPLMKLSDKIEQSSIGTKIADIAATLGLSAATQSLIWPITVIIALLALMVIGLVAVVAVAAHFSKQFAENAQATLDQAKANEELIDSNQELAGSVRELIDEYQELSATGESTYDTLEKLKEQMPELIDSYKELERNLGLDLGLEKLEQAYKAAQATGNWGEVEV